MSSIAGNVHTHISALPKFQYYVFSFLNARQNKKPFSSFAVSDTGIEPVTYSTSKSRSTN